MNAPAAESPEPRFVRPPRAAIFALALLVLAVPIGLVALRLARGSGLPAANMATFEGARERWKQNRLPDYNIEIEVAGRQPATYCVEVRGGEPQAAFRNGQPLRQQRTFHTWTVDGMFETLSGDMTRLFPDGPDAPPRRDPPFVLRVRYDERFGYPAAYQRSEYGTGIDVEWNVLRIEPQPEAPRE